MSPNHIAQTNLFKLSRLVYLNNAATTGDIVANVSIITTRNRVQNTNNQSQRPEHKPALKRGICDVIESFKACDVMLVTHEQSS